MEYLSIDFETRSTVDLRRSGVYAYAEHPDTSIICMAWAIGDMEPEVWVPGDAFPSDVTGWIRSHQPMRAHNAQFERVMWRDCLYYQSGLVPRTVPGLEQWHDTAAEAAAMSLPRHLADVARVLNLAEQKDDEGHRLMLQMCRPRAVEKDGTIRWWDEEDFIKKQRLIDYCKQDVRTERAVAKKLRRLSPTERQVYLLDQIINDRGVRLDVELIRALKKLVRRGTKEANEELTELTNGAVTSVTQVAQLTEWLQQQGAALDNIRKDTLRDTLESPGLPARTRRVIEIRQEAGKSSTAKLRAMERTRCADDRARGLMLYHGASTGRWSGKLIQPQNFPRPEIKDVEQYIPAVLAQDRTAFRHAPLEIASSLLRSCLIASEGSRFLAGDFSQIEARITGWLAGEPYRDHEYERMAGAIFRKPWQEIEKGSFERFVGKGTVLGCGFGMGWQKLQKQFQKQTGIRIEDRLAREAVETYRRDKVGIAELWKMIEGFALDAVRYPGRVFALLDAFTVEFVVRGAYLWCILPSGRPLAYALPQIEAQVTDWGMKEAVTYMGINGYTRKWERMSTYGGHMVENIVQATARDVLAEAMLRLEKAGYPIVLTVHDEVVADVPEGQGSLDEFLAIMKETPSWATGLEIEVEGWEGGRYRK